MDLIRRSRPRLAAVAALAALVLATGCAGPPPATPVAGASTPAPPAIHPSVDDYPVARLRVTGADGTATELDVRVADTPARRQHGLMEVTDLPATTGMWFVYDEDQTGGFWMKGTLIPLDIAWVDRDGVVVHVLTMAPCVADPCTVHTPPVAYRAALEVAAGWYADRGITVGDRVVAIG